MANPSPDEGVRAALEAAEKAFGRLVDPDAKYVSAEICLPADSHGDAIRRLDDARRALAMIRAALSADAAATIAAARKQAAEDKARLDWLEANSNVDIAYEGWEEDVWQVHTVNGGRSNREWTLRGEGVTVRQAIDTAIETLRLRAEDQQKATATPTIADPDGEARS